jgi:hypothetical protein
VDLVARVGADRRPVLVGQLEDREGNRVVERPKRHGAEASTRPISGMAALASSFDSRKKELRQYRDERGQG